MGLFVFFIAISFKATKLVRENMGIIASIIFVFGLLSFVGNSSYRNENKEPNSNHIKTWKYISEDSLKSNSTNYVHVNLEHTLISDYYLGITYGKDKQGQINIPISAYSSTNGLISGRIWKPLNIMVNNTNDNNKFAYSVVGNVEWKLLGATIYSQWKVCNGVTKVK